MRELQVAGEIAQAFLTAERPHEVYHLALERVAPLVSASFSCVFLRDEGDEELLRVAATFDWPQRFVGYLESLRVRVGNGPTGRAVAENKLIEAPDVFADPELEDWWESARELDFRSSISLPLAFDGRTVGALTFYFRDPRAFANVDRSMLRLVADQLSATAQKVYLIEDLQRVNEQLREQNVDLEARYREAEEAKRVKHDLLANVSHELRTPLTAILGYAYLLKEGVSGELGEEQSASVERIEAAGGQLLTLIDGLLDLTSLRLGRVETQPELCDAVALARAALSNTPATRDGVELKQELPNERVPVHTDPALALRVLASLLSNAVKFTIAGSITLRVRLAEPGETDSPSHLGHTVLWEVEDTGVGIESDHLEVIFEDFRQADGSVTRRFGGAGLGLPLARGLARRLGGEVSVRSEPGQGTTFTFALPSSVTYAGNDRE